MYRHNTRMGELAVRVCSEASHNKSVGWVLTRKTKDPRLQIQTKKS